MPIYEYDCCDCANTFELLRQMEDVSVEIPCTKCGSASRRRVSIFSSYSKGEGGGIKQIAGGGCCGGGGGCACSMSV